MSSDELEYYIPKFKLDQLMPNGYQYSLKKINDLEKEFKNVLFNRSCSGMTRDRADELPNVISFGVKAILIDKETRSHIWLVDETFSKDRKKKISIPGGHLSVPYDDDTVESFLKDNLIRELCEEFSSNKNIISSLYPDDIEYHLSKLGFQDVEDVEDGWYYQYTPNYISFFKVINVIPNQFISNRNAVPFSLNDYDMTERLYKFRDTKNFNSVVREKLDIPSDIKSDIRILKKGRYSKMLGSIMELVKELKTSDN